MNKMVGRIIISIFLSLSFTSCSDPAINDKNFVLDSTNYSSSLNYNTYSNGTSSFDDFNINYSHAMLSNNYHVKLTRGGTITNECLNDKRIKIHSIQIVYQRSEETPYGTLKLKTSSSIISDPEIGGELIESGNSFTFSNNEQPLYFSIYSPTSDYYISSVSLAYNVIDKVVDTYSDRTIDIYSANDFHGKVEYMNSYYPGASKITNYINKSMLGKESDSLILSSGDMYQGYADSNITHGDIAIQYMNNVGFSAMTIGNHEFDWGQDVLKENVLRSNFKYLALNIYDKATNKRISWAEPSTLINKSGLKIGVIGATTAYSSISNRLVNNLEFKTGDALFSLIREESNRLRDLGADFIIYLVHNGVSSSSSSSSYDNVNFYSPSLGGYSETHTSSRYVDFVIEGHTHQSYQIKDSAGVWHVQNNGDGQSLYKTSVSFNYANNKYNVSTLALESINEDTLMQEKEETIFGNNSTKDSIYKYYYDNDIKETKEEVATTVSPGYSSSEVGKIAAETYYKHYKEQANALGYDITLGGAQFKMRSPYTLKEGTVTYGEILTILPFDNTIGIASAKGSKLKQLFFSSSYSYYYCYPSELTLNDDDTYYIITDSWTYDYSPNKMNIVHEFDDLLYARDMVFEYLSSL
jgi:2',3'-cyclic-nucleotide 2'-phosphodiesterase/3'-nucleotidase